MVGWIVCTIFVVVVFLCAYHLVSVLGEMVKLARDIFDHMHVKHLAELAVGMQIAAIANGDECEDCSLAMAVMGASHKMNDALMSNGYEVGKWNARGMVLAVLGQRDYLVKIRAVIEAAGEAKQ